ncbi:MAG TPA: hypothetical protein VHM26_13370 [Chitinophagaceae bacterium]|jgi:heme/copper-type cytochrome/quinol oxidase subunit 2|nr:hypothetical protein [Chitinophagaceae bacterium]
MQKASVILILVLALALGYFGHNFLQQKIQPKQSAQRLLWYIISVMLLVMVLVFGMTYLVAVLFPNEIRK